METVNVSITTWPVIQSAEEADAHDQFAPALVAVPGHLVRPIYVMIEKLFSLDTPGTLARGIEMQLVGLAEPDSSCVQRGLRDVTNSVPHFVRVRGAGEMEIVEADEADASAGINQSATPLRLVKTDKIENRH